MTRSLRLGYLAVAIALMAAFAVQAEEKKAPQTYVVLVGVSSFEDSAIHARPAAEKDAKGLYQLLTSKDHATTSTVNAKLLLGSEDKSVASEPATRDNIIKALKWVTENSHKQDMVIIGIFGEGAPVLDRTCYFLKNSTVKDRVKNALQSSEIEESLKDLKSEKILALVDINFKGFTPETNSVAEPNIVDMINVFVGNEDKDEHTLPPGHVIFMASNTVAKPIDTETNGLFAKTVIEGLKGAADKEGYEPDGAVTVDELKTYLEKEIPAQARVLGKSREEKEQAALVWGSRSSHFAVTKNPAVAPKNEARAEKLGKLELPKDVIEEGTRLITRMPKLKALQELRKLYIKLAEGEVDSKAFLAERAKIQTAMKLDKEDADAFAEKVLRAAENVKQVYVKELNLGEMVGWAVKGMYRGLDEQVPAELKAKIDESRNLRRGQMSDLLAEARERLGKREDLEDNKDADMAIRTMLFNLDPHTMYFDKAQVLKMDTQLLGRYPGVGIQIRRDMVRDGLLVVSPIKGSPAYRAGIKAGDLITEIIRPVDEKGKPLNPPEVLSTKGMKTDEAVEKILGTAGTKVKLKILREGKDEPYEVDLTRATINVETVFGVKRLDDDSWDYMLDPQSKIGYIRLSQFAPNSYIDMKRVVTQLQKNGMKGLILDLRYNPGGLLTTAVEISDMFIEDGLIVTIKPRSGAGDEEAITKTSTDKFTNFPLVCMVNDMSASGSEIVSACLQDHNRAVILGERSYGKGSVQNIMRFPQTGGRIKYTFATFWRPNGQNLNKLSTTGKPEDTWGVKPDEGFNVPLSRGARDALFEQMRDSEVIPNREAKPKEAKPPVKDEQLDKALGYLQGQIKTAQK
ncbi:MAG: S41 family peptidase [Gemmataceae bacterium]